ncbi:MAE_28990/MAE_18760 family HEPN-like nuclease [Stenotrophomonas rhizophila]
MMDSVKEEVDRRLQEIEILLRFIKEIERPRSRVRAVMPASASSATILKASIFLLLYNAIESCVRMSFQQMYSEMRTEGVSFADVHDGIKDVWIKQEFSVSAATANQETYMERAKKIAYGVVLTSLPELDPRKLPISGSLDGGAIRKLCNKHGISFNVPKRANGGAELATIKEQRNSLAHGHKSFAECGRDYGVSDLERIYKQTKHFLSGFTKCMAKFNASKGFLVNP